MDAKTLKGIVLLKNHRRIHKAILSKGFRKDDSVDFYALARAKPLASTDWQDDGKLSYKADLIKYENGVYIWYQCNKFIKKYNLYAPKKTAIYSKGAFND